MSLLQIVSIIIFLIVCVFLVILILLQSGKGGSLGMIGGGASQNTFSSSSIDIITRITWYFLVAFFVTAILAAILFAEGIPEVVKPAGAPLLDEIPGSSKEAQEPADQRPPM